jgi:hypothetical protein
LVVSVMRTGSAGSKPGAVSCRRAAAVAVTAAAMAAGQAMAPAAAAPLPPGGRAL